ncbi:HD domain-containing protein [Caminibacter pacificus]|uniref:HD domain-containing protein n=1 Tax=Caminibacter pacificus TaxID=1424653 RepID=A0AAJ4RE98_9BACT|nr:HD domain-containing protein [Caminibacter pacificus]NPA88287.1 HD domain-containing protein [Campylobacterota bacterium]QCI28312.1 HD domain-containing protein [Caminibacter pacificus]ROR40974.1 putative hydrolase of HD superfamily [Caminibacter pacificus]
MNAKLVKLIFTTASIERWNDIPRPLRFMELDKQAHEMIIAYILGHYEKKIDFIKLINLAIAGLLYRAVLTDLKSPVYKYLRKHKGKELDEFVINNLKSIVDDELLEYIEIYNNTNCKERRILKAASYLASKWEFDFIYNFAKDSYGIEEIKKSLEDELEDYYDLEGVRILALKRKAYDFISLCGNLRFQKRWANTPRVPETSVLGHMLFVAVMSFLFTKEYGGNPHKLYYNFFTGLFHDLPEALTRDIIAPVKQGVAGLDEILKDYENMLIEEKILPLAPLPIQKELKILITDEFANKLITENGYKKVDIAEDLLGTKGIDGSLVKAADHFAAFVEALMSIKHGIKSPELINAVEYLKNRYKNKKIFSIELKNYFNERFFDE